MIKLRKVALLGLFVPVLLIGIAQAAEPGFYIGGSVGQTTVDKDANDFGYKGDYSPGPGSPAVPRNFKIDDDDTGWKAFIGYQYLNWLGFEGGYVDFGGASDKYQGTNVDVDITGWDGFMVLSLPLGSWDLFAKVGAINLKTDLNVGSSSDDDNDVQLAYGAGIAYNFGHWSIRAEAEGFDDNEVDDFYFLSAGLSYRFGGGKKKAAPVAAAPVAAPVEQCADTDTDGVCDDADVCPGTPAGTRVDSIGCACNYVLTLEFALDSAELSEYDMEKLDRLVPVLTNPKAGAMRGVIDGYTDSTGSEAYNLKLSERRAEAVANYLSSKGVSGKFTTHGYGEANPVASNDTEEGRVQNRRIELKRTDCQ